MNPPSALNAALHSRCPQCRKGDVFKNSPLSVNFADTHETCNHCGLKYEPEPGFFWGAMYINYAFTVAIFLVTSGVIYAVWHPDSLWVYILSLVSIIVITLPFLVRYSRIAMLYLFGPAKFRPELYNRVAVKTNSVATTPNSN